MDIVARPWLVLIKQVDDSRVTPSVGRRRFKVRECLINEGDRFFSPSPFRKNTAVGKKNVGFAAAIATIITCKTSVSTSATKKKKKPIAKSAETAAFIITITYALGELLTFLIGSRRASDRGDISRSLSSLVRRWRRPPPPCVKKSPRRTEVYINFFFSSPVAHLLSHNFLFRSSRW